MPPDMMLLQKYIDTADEAVFVEIVRKYADLVYSAGLRILRDKQRAEDVAQETFLRLVNNPRGVNSSLIGWLHATATRLAIDEYRSQTARRQREQTSASAATERAPALDAGNHATWRETSALIDASIAELPEELRGLLIQHFLQGRAQNDLAIEYDLAPSTVCRKIQTALDLMREKLRKRGVTLTAVMLGTMLAGMPLAEAAPPTLLGELGRLAILSGLRPSAPAGPSLMILALRAAMGAVVLAVLAALLLALVWSWMPEPSTGPM